MFRSLTKLARHGWTTKPDDLNEAGLKALQLLRKNRDWQAFAQVLDSRIEELAEELITAQTTELMWEARGKITGLRESILMVEAIIKTKEGKDARTDRAATELNERAVRRARSVRNSPFAGTH